MKHRRMGAILLAAGVTVSVLSACGDEKQPVDPVDTPTTTTTTTATAAKPTYYIVADTLNVRSGPGTENEVIGTLSYGTVVEVLATEDGWCRIAYEGAEAYVSAEFVSQQTTADTTATTTTTTTTTTQTPGTTTSPQYTDRYIDAEGMLQFEPGDNYVQKNSYGSAEIPWNLLLVNDWNPIPKGYEDSVTMQAVEQKYAQVNSGQKVDARMYDDLIAMLEAGSAYNIGVQSSFRGYDHQKRLYNNQVNKWKGTYSDPVLLQTKAGEVVKRPGFSEHNSGLAVDLYGSGNTSLSPSFANTQAYAWLMEHCADYGFILRFPQGKEDITGVIYEAWHFRYVGDPDIAHAIMDNGLCLEEYLRQVGK